MAGDPQVEPRATANAGPVLTTLAAAQFLMALDSSVINVSVATVAQDLGTTVTGIQGAITFFTLVMASLMITGGRIGQILGRKRAFAVGCVVYGAGALTTALSPNLLVLLAGWSVLEGIGAALVMPAVVALVAANFGPSERPRAYGTVAAAGAVAVAVGPLIGGLLTTYASWRWVFAGEVGVVVGVLLLARRIQDTPPEPGARLDLVGTGLSATGLALVVLGVLRAGVWGAVNPKPGAPAWAGLSPVVWLVLTGGLVLLAFVSVEAHRTARGLPVLLDPALLRSGQLRGGLTAFFFQYLVLGGLFFVVPLFLSVALGFSAVGTGLCIVPLSATLILTALGVPKLLPQVSPRRVVRLGFAFLFLGVVALLAVLEIGVTPDVIIAPLVLIGLAIGALASQLGSVTVSAVPDERSAEVGGLQNTVTNLGSSIGTALGGALLLAALTSSFLTGIQRDPAIPAALSSQAVVRLEGGVPFTSDDELRRALTDAGVTGTTAAAVVRDNAEGRLAGLRSSLSALALAALVALFFTRRVPSAQPPAPAPTRPALVPGSEEGRRLRSNARAAPGTGRPARGGAPVHGPTRPDGRGQR